VPDADHYTALLSPRYPVEGAMLVAKKRLIVRDGNIWTLAPVELASVRP